MGNPKYFPLQLVLCFISYKFSFSTEDSTINNKTPQYLENLLNTNGYEEFADILDIPNVDLVDPSQRKTSDQEMFYYNGLDLGDILLRPGQFSDSSHHFDFNGNITLKVNKWKNGTVPYYISKAFFDNETDFLKSEIRYYNQLFRPNLNLRPYQDGDTDYVLIFKGGSGCYTNLGYVGGPQVISLTGPCLYVGELKHKLQHTLGFAHESNRIDRDDYLELITENIPQAMKSQFGKYTVENWINMEAFDYYSIVMYPVKVPGFTNLNEFKLFESGLDLSRIGHEKFLSPIDIQRVKAVYSS